MTHPESGVAGAAVSAALRAACDSSRIGGGAVGLIVGGLVTTLTVAGTSRLERGEVRTKTPFGIGSITKTLTALAVARSSELSFGARVADVLADVSFDDARSFESVTIADVLGQTSGLPFLARDRGPVDGEALSRFVSDDLAHHEFHAAPGELALYSPSAYSLAGRVLEVTSGVPFEDALIAQALDPGGMAGAAFPGDREAANEMGDNASAHPAGFMLASLEDLVRLARSLIAEGLVDDGQWSEMARQHASRHISHIAYPLALISSGFGLGCQVGMWNGQAVARQPARQWSYRCSLDLLPESRSAIVLLTESAEESAFNELLRLSYEAVGGLPKLPSEPGLSPVDTELRRAWQGVYTHPSRGITVTVADRDGDLFYESDDVVAPLYNVGEGRALAPLSYGSAPLWFPQGEDQAQYLKVWGETYFRESAGDWGGLDRASASGRYRDSFWPDDATDVEVRWDVDGWEVVRAGVSTPATELGPTRLATTHGVIAFAEDFSGIKIGGAARYSRT